APTAGNRFEDAVAHAGALGAEVGALVAHADDEAPAVQVQRIHHIGGIDVLAHAEVVDERLFLVVELAGVEPADQALDTRCADARAEAAEAIIDAPRLEIGQGQVVEIVVDPDFAVVGLVAAAELAAELELSGVALNVVVAGQVQADGLLPVTGVALFPLHFVELETGRVVESRLHGQRRLARAGKARVAEVPFEYRTGNAARVALARFAVAGLTAQRPQAKHAFATEHVGLDGLGVLARLELAPALGVAALAGLLGVIEGDAGSVARLGVLEAAVERAQVKAAVIVGLVVEVEAEPGTLTGDLVVALFQLLESRAVFEIPVTAGFDVVRAEIPLLPAQRRGDTEVVDPVPEAEAIADGPGELRALLADVLVMTALGADAVEQPVVVEGRQAFHFDGAAQGVGVHVRGERLDHRQRLHQLGRQHIQRHGTTVAFRRGHQGAVDGHAVQVRGDAAHADEAAFALVALHR